MQEGKVYRSYDCGAMLLRTLRIFDCEGYGLTRDDVVMIAVCGIHKQNRYPPFTYRNGSYDG